jgi:hypothetical protein
VDALQLPDEEAGDRRTVVAADGHQIELADSPDREAARSQRTCVCY